MVEIFDKNCNDLDVINIQERYTRFDIDILIEARINETSRKLIPSQVLYDINGNCYMIINKKTNEAYITFECWTIK